MTKPIEVDLPHKLGRDEAANPAEPLALTFAEGFPASGAAIDYLQGLEVDGAVNSDAAWTYPEPKDAAKEITGRLAFWKGVEVR